MKCNASVDGECLYNHSNKSPWYHLKFPTRVDDIYLTEEQIKKFTTFPNESTEDVEIKRIPLSLIKCDGEKGKEGCPYKDW